MRATQTGIFRRAPPASPLHSKLPLGFQFCENHRTPPARRIEWGNVEVRRTTPLPSPSLALPWSCFFCAIAAGQPIYCTDAVTTVPVTDGYTWTRLDPAGPTHASHIAHGPTRSHSTVRHAHGPSGRPRGPTGSHTYASRDFLSKRARGCWVGENGESCTHE